MSWVKIDSFVESFLDAEEAETITIVRTGFENEYVVVYDDSLHSRTGDCHLMNKEEIENTYKIKLEI